MLHTPDEFLNAIEAHPADRMRRLIFADWLDEHHDPRGELIRIEEEMRELPVFADRFWELKPRRNELRAQAGTEWCGRMRYGTECEPVFQHGIPEGWRERWRLTREFTERWHRIPMPDVGGRQAEIAEVEASVGRKLPLSVREWVAFHQDVDDVPSHASKLRLPRVQAIPGVAAVSLSFSVPENSRLIVHLSDSHRTDPPVHEHSWESGGLFGEFTHDTPTADSVTAFALNRVVSYADRANSFFAEMEQPSDLCRHLKATFASHVKVGNCEWDESDNLLVEIEPAPGRRGIFWLTVRATETIRADQIPEFLWQYARLSNAPNGIFAPRQS
jgi:uncharacterized protein (TIGR02996 family)